MHVGRAPAADADGARRHVEHGVGTHAAAFQRPGDDQRLHRRARLEHVGDGAVAQLVATQVAAVAGVKTGVVGQGQDLAGAGIQHHGAAGLGLVLGDSLAQRLVGEELHLGIQAELHVVAVQRRHGGVLVLDDAAHAVAQHLALAVLALQVTLEGQLDAFLPLILQVGEAHHVRTGLALRVLTAVLALLVHAL